METAMTNTNRSTLFTNFNAAKSLARRGRLEEGRVNRALGIAQQTGETHIEKYGSTATGCTCPDRRFRGVTCKGMIALALKAVA